jgi:hypothetical protein
MDGTPPHQPEPDPHGGACARPSRALPDIVIFERVLPLEAIDAFWCPGDLTGHPRNRHDPTPNTPEFA